MGLDVTTQALDPGQQAMQQHLYGQANPLMQYGPGNVAQGFDFNNQNAMQQLRGLSNRQEIFGNAALRRGNQSYYDQRQVGKQAMQAYQGAGHAANVGMMGLGLFANQNNPYLNQQIGGLAQDFGQLYQEQILPGIQSGFSGGGQRGSSRQGIAEALSGQRVAQEFGQAATNMRSSAYAQQLQAAGQLAQLGTAGAQGYLGMAGDIYGQQAQYQYGTGLQALNQSQQASLGQGSLANQYASTAMRPFEIGAGIVGSPSVLTQGLGLDYSQSTSSSTSKGSASSAKIGIG
jgi:hypothetical protein